jgi:formylglycine-generating enzyme required for sulfatase activity
VRLQGDSKQFSDCRRFSAPDIGQAVARFDPLGFGRARREKARGRGGHRESSAAHTDQPNIPGVESLRGSGGVTKSKNSGKKSGKNSGENSGESHAHPSGEASDLVTLSGSLPAAATDEPEAALSTQESGDGAPGVADDEFDVLARGATIGRYLVLERIGAGAMGVVYAAYDPELDRKIALKLLRPQGQATDLSRRQARMVREAKAIAKLSHPNVVGIFDVGVHEGQVFMAMEHLAGGTLRDWSAAKKRSWRETVQLFIAIGRGLAGAHAEGLVHRDFKPDNVLLDKNGVPKVVDFGLVRLAASAVELSSSGAFQREKDDAAAPATTVSEPGDAGSLTRTGALTGTPAYMASEQFRSEAVDARTDQFAFCVTLYEALYGERPFAGDNILALADSVLRGRVREAPKESQVPGWVRRVVLRGLEANPDRRLAGMDDLIAVLADDPAVARRRRLVAIGVAALLVGTVVTARQISTQRQTQIESRIAAHLREGDAAMTAAAADTSNLLRQRTSALAAFDKQKRADGERLWREALRQMTSVDGAYETAERAFESALGLDVSRSSVRDRIGNVLLSRLVLAEMFYRQTDVGLFASRLQRFDPDGAARKLTETSSISIRVTPRDVDVRLERYRLDVAGLRTPVEEKAVTAAALGNLQLAPGSYRLMFRRKGGKTVVFYPFLLTRGGTVEASIAIPEDAEIPEGFVYVPAGEFLFGEADESMRTSFLDTVPIQLKSAPAFLMARNETTYEEWIAYLDSLPPRERQARSPRVSNSPDGLYSGSVQLKEIEPRLWRLELSPSGTKVSAMLGERLHYPGRTERRAQDWRRFPVSGISPRDAEAFARWLDSTGKVHGARLCSELEWERAARGADDRRFPSGDALGGMDANIDETYGRRSDAFGPDEVGSHQGSNSPFGVEDMAGNALEMTYSSLDSGGFVARGGGFYHDKRSAWTTNRAGLEPNTRLHTFGIRLCADPRTDSREKGRAR